MGIFWLYEDAGIRKLFKSDIKRLLFNGIYHIQVGSDGLNVVYFSWSGS